MHRPDTETRQSTKPRARLETEGGRATDQVRTQAKLLQPKGPLIHISGGVAGLIAPAAHQAPSPAGEAQIAKGIRGMDIVAM